MKNCTSSNCESSQDAGALSNPLSLLRGGYFYWYGAGVHDRGGYGDYWLARSVNTNSSFNLQLAYNYLNPQLTDSRGYGHAVRCLSLPIKTLPILCYNKPNMYKSFIDFIKDKKRLCIIQAENPDGDSLGSAIALDYLISLNSENDPEISLYCPVDIPKYLRYFSDWSRVENEFDWKADGYIIVDTAAEVLLSKLLEDSAIKNRLETTPVFVLDHHETEDDLSFPHEKIIEPLPACCDLIYKIIKETNLKTDENVAKNLIYGILSDTLGLTSASSTPETFRHIADLLETGNLNIADLEEARREFMKKSPRILDYKADLIKRIEYFLDGKLAIVHIPWEDIREYSDEYNPNVLILEELRLVEGVDVAVAIKTYPEGKVTGKIRTGKPVADKIAGFYGGGGHPYAAGFRTYDISYDEVVRDLVRLTHELLETP